jgi:branched-chain amino acid transport system ATP-binding protein
MGTVSGPALRLDGLSLAFGGVQALKDVSFDVHDGQTVGLLGPNGAGKTTLVNCLTGIYRPTSGRVELFGEPIIGRKASALVQLGIARTFQQAAGLKQVGAFDVLLLGRQRFMTRGILRYAVGLGRRAEREARASAMDVARLLGIEAHCRANTPFDGLPYGVRKLVDLGRALACEPRVLLLDEPAGGLSQDEKAQMIDVIAQVQRDSGVTQVLVEHDVEFVRALCRRLVVLDAGQKLAEGDFDEVIARPEVVASYIGED